MGLENRCECHTLTRKEGRINMKTAKCMYGLLIISLCLSACSATASATPISTQVLTAAPTRIATLIPVETMTNPTNMSLANGAITQFQCGTEIYQIVYSPNGTLLATTNGRAIFICDLKSEHIQMTLDSQDEKISSIAWSPDGKWLVSGSSNGMTRIRDIVTGKEISAFKANTVAIAWSPDAQRLATAGDGIHVFDPSTGKELVTFTYPFHPIDFGLVAWSPDGTRIAGGCSCGVVEIWNAASGNPLISLRPSDPSPKSVLALTWSPDSKYIASSLSDSIFLFETATGKVTTSLTPQGAVSFGNLRWSPDGKWLAAGELSNAMIEVWKTDTWGTSVVFKNLGQVYALAWSQDSKYLASGSYDGTITVWSAQQFP
jgi:WD40 repeat protein